MQDLRTTLDFCPVGYTVLPSPTGSSASAISSVSIGSPNVNPFDRSRDQGGITNKEYDSLRERSSTFGSTGSNNTQLQQFTSVAVTWPVVQSQLSSLHIPPAAPSASAAQQEETNSAQFKAEKGGVGAVLIVFVGTLLLTMLAT
ncbi:hypothetical protein DL96DRAFT_1716546 [Flagelloscypha sp. PMI_526]|nr:hypothetical protein DL96DRAFT_1716546 [Flagelloscypha sp. PMI_526]